MNTMVIGIAGGTGSGKTTVTEKLQEYFGADVSVLHHDSYYKRHDELPFEKRRLLNYDHPDSFDTSLLIEDLRSLKAGHTVHCPVYDYSIHNRTDRTEEVHPTKVIIVEGILIFADEELASEMDIKIFVDTDADERILRRILRDVRERGRTLESVVEPVPHHGKADARAVCGAQQAPGGYHHAAGWPQSCRAGYAHRAHPQPHRPGDISAKRKTGRPISGTPFLHVFQSTDFIDSTILIFFSR